VREGSVSVRIPNPLNFCLHKLIIAQRRGRPEKAHKDLEQAIHLLPILDPAEFRAEAAKLPKKWREMIRKSLAKARTLYPSELPTLSNFDLTPQ